MKLYSLYSKSHVILKDEWFLPSLQDDYDCELVEAGQLCPSGEYMSEGFLPFNIKQVELMLRAVKENWGRCFVYADIDIQFFKPSSAQLLQLLKGKDMVVQRDDPSGMLCAGFLCSRANDKTLALWEDIREIMLHKSPYHNQDLLNALMIGNVSKSTMMEASGAAVTDSRKAPWHRYGRTPYLNRVRPGALRRKIKALMPNAYGLKWDYLPPAFFGGGTLSGREWRPGMSLSVPDPIVLHHANWTVGIGNKIAQLKYVKKTVDQKGSGTGLCGAAV